jgi:hypothetical protein
MAADFAAAVHHYPPELVARLGRQLRIVPLVRVEKIGPLFTGHLNHSLEAFLEPRQGMVDQEIFARHFDLELGNRRAAGGTVSAWTSVIGAEVIDASDQALSKISPMAWKLEVLLGPPTPK